MSKDFTYTGTLVHTPYTGNSVSGRHHKDTNFRSGDNTISWSETVPSVLAGTTNWESVEEALRGVPHTWVYDIHFRIRGTQHYDDDSSPVAYIHIGSIEKDFEAHAPGSIGAGRYDTEDTKRDDSDEPPESMYIRVYNKCAEHLPGCACYGAKDFDVKLTMTYTLKVTCEGTALGLPICLQACQKCDKESCVCKEAYVDYCLPTDAESIPLVDPNRPGTLINPPPISDSKVCQNFIADLISNVDPDARVDQGLNSYCQAKYRGFGDLFNGNPNQKDIALCACHMPAEQYQAFEDQIDKDYPGLGNLGIDDRCLVPQCASSVYKSVQTGSVCNVPKCLVINSFNNNGTFDNSTVNVNTSVPGCADISGGNIPSNGGGETRRRDIAIIGGLFLLMIIILIIVVIAISASGRKSKK